MPITESSATALVRFSGLGIVVFNQKKQRGEVGIIRDDKHTLTVKLQQPKFANGAEKDLIIYQDIAVYKNLPRGGVVIDIKAKGKSPIKGFDVYQAKGNFNRMKSEDYNDFRWVVNLRDVSGQKPNKKKRGDRFPLSKLFIENGLFYVHKLDTNLFFEKVEKNSLGQETKRADFGFIGETVGVKLESEVVIFSITIDGKESIHKLESIGLPYRIEIENRDYNMNAAMSDMPEYQKYIYNSDGTSVDLQPKTPGSHKLAQPVGVKMFCHPGEGGGVINSIDELEA